jgi:hypothetical protein
MLTDKEYLNTYLKNQIQYQEQERFSGAIPARSVSQDFTAAGGLNQQVGGVTQSFS